MKATEKNKKQTWGKLAVYTVGGMLLGFLTAFLGNDTDAQSGLAQLKETLPGMLSYALPVVFVLIECGITLAAMIAYFRVKKQYAALHPDDEDGLYVIEQKVNVPICLYNVGIVLDACFFSIMIFLSEHKSIEDTLWESILIVGGAAMLILNIGLLMWVGTKSIELVKLMNPEKRGDFLDPDFQKKWESSLDEAEKLIQYKGAYKAYKAAQAACFILWFANMVLHGGILTTIFIAVIWLTMVIVYQNEVVRLESGKKS